jgi:hypothetical protein
MTTKEPVIIAGVPMTVKEQLREFARVDEVSVSEIGRQAFQEYLERRTVSST